MDDNCGGAGAGREGRSGGAEGGSGGAAPPLPRAASPREACTQHLLPAGCAVRSLGSPGTS
eukprot:scaffold33563_cov52-Phaeocystis_antarctica.AAC.3